MSEPVSISYKCKFCGNQQNKSLRSGPPNPGVCLKAPEDGKGWHLSLIHILRRAPSMPLALLSSVRFLMSCCSSVEAPCLEL